MLPSHAAPAGRPSDVSDLPATCQEVLCELTLADTAAEPLPFHSTEILPLTLPVLALPLPVLASCCEQLLLLALNDTGANVQIASPRRRTATTSCSATRPMCRSMATVLA